MKNRACRPSLKRQSGAAIVEFAIIGGLLLAFIYAIFEFGRMMFVYNTMQEISRRGAREAAVRWMSDADQTDIRKYAVFGATRLPGSMEITDENVKIRYLQANGVDPVINPPADAGDNMAACNDVLRTASCVMYVEVKVKDVVFTPLIFKPGSVTVSKPANTMPEATTVVYAESLGFTN
ncbi:TadE/TadG family type IV pilus assembly protein [Pseudoduganella sp. R-34]|uniref:TadE/TadG family type IV pilus assembly protein n=1 Tax=unclassified Pseudoduganella TaxID=2637179 RepID=UPI003CFA3A67